MKIVNYKTLEERIKYHDDYNHGSSNGRRYDVDGIDYYEVTSYSTKIFRLNISTGRVSYWNGTKYSRTTSKLQSIIMRTHPQVGAVTA